MPYSRNRVASSPVKAASLARNVWGYRSSKLGSSKSLHGFAHGDTLGRAYLVTRSELWAHWQMGVRRGSMAGAV